MEKFLPLIELCTKRCPVDAVFACRCSWGGGYGRRGERGETRRCKLILFYSGNGFSKQSAFQTRQSKLCGRSKVIFLLLRMTGQDRPLFLQACLHCRRMGLVYVISRLVNIINSVAWRICDWIKRHLTLYSFNFCVESLPFCKADTCSAGQEMLHSVAPEGLLEYSKSCYKTQSWTIEIQYTSQNPIYLKYILILSSHTISLTSYNRVLLYVKLIVI